MIMTSAVPTKPECLMRRLHRNNRQGVFVCPPAAIPRNSTKAIGREGGGDLRDLAHI